jgi:Fe2+ transport system protein FeoA
MKIFNVIDVPQPEDCKKCTPCLRLRMMEMGFISGQKIEIMDKRLGLWLVNILSNNDNVASTIALRQEELDRICLKEIK